MKSLEKSHIPSLWTILYYSEKGGPLSRVSPWSKLLGLFLFVAAATIIQSLSLLILLYLFSLLLYLVGKLPFRKLLGWSLFPAFFVLTVSIMFVFSQPGKALITVPGVLMITDGGVLLVVKLLLRGLAVVNYSLTFIMSTKYSELVGLADKLMPNPLDMIFVLTFRFIFVVLEVMETSLRAAWARGGSLRKGLVSKSSLYARIFAVNVLYSFERAEKVGKAMEARGFSGKLKSYEQLKTPSLAGWSILALSFFAIIMIYLFEGMIL